MKPRITSDKLMLIDELRKIVAVTESKRAVTGTPLSANVQREHTLQEIGQLLGITRERVRQIEANALKKLQNKNSSNMLGDFTEP